MWSKERKRKRIKNSFAVPKKRKHQLHEGEIKSNPRILSSKRQAASKAESISKTTKSTDRNSNKINSRQKQKNKR